MIAAASPTLLPSRQELRSRLLQDRTRFVASAAATEAGAALGRALRAVIVELEPQSLGLYWPHRGEFNAAAVFAEDEGLAKWPLALPFAHREPAEMHYRLWDRRPPRLVDGCGIAASDGAVVVPDVVLVPCLGFTDSGYRLGYGGGYFDRWLAAQPQVCAVGVAWSIGRIDEAALAPQAHDMRMTLIVSEHGAV